MANIIKPKRSSVAGKVPTNTDIVNGEIAINSTDQKIYTNAGGTVTQVGAGVLDALGDVVLTSPTSGQSLSYNGTNWVNSAAGSGDVTGAASSTDNAVTRFDGTTGKAIQNSTVTLDDNGNFANVNAVGFDTTPGTLPTAAGSMYWDSADGNQTLSLVMAGGNVTQQIGEEQYYRIKASSAITNGQAVMFTGTVGGSGALTGAPASGLTDATSTYFMGVATEDIALNGWGYVTNFGLVRGINTTGGAESWVDGQILYYNPSVAGGLTKTIPSAPAAKIQVAVVVNAASGGSGSLFVRSTINVSLEDLNDVETASASTNDLLQYDGSKWLHKAPSTVTGLGGLANALTIGTGLGGTSYNGTSAVTITNTGVTSVVAGTGISVSGATGAVTVTNSDRGSSQNIFKNIAVSGQSTVVADTNDDTLTLAAGTGITITTNATTDTITIAGTGGTVTSVSGTAPISVATGTSTPAISITQAGAASNGYLSSTDWNTFNNKTSNTGTVTSVAMTVPTGLTISGTPITTSGTLALTFTAGYSIPTTASQTNWDTAYSDRLKWDGGSTGLVAATGRTSLGGTTVGQNFFTLTNPGAITFPRINADNTVSALDAATFRTAIGAGTSSTTGTVTSVGMTVPTGLSISGTPITTSGTLALTFTAGYSIPTTASQTNWDSAYTQRLQWDGGSTNLVAATGRTSLGATTLGSNLFTITNPGAITFPRFNADNTVSALDAATFRSAIGAGTGSGTVTSVATGTGLTGGTITTTGTISLANTAVTAGAYTNANITVDAQGRITAASSGSSGGVTSLAAGTGISVSASTGAVTVTNSSPNIVTATTGSAPYYGARAWAFWNGTNGSIYASGNVSSITRFSPSGYGGGYTINFTTAMPDANYASVVSTSYASGANSSTGIIQNYSTAYNNSVAPTTASFSCVVLHDANNVVQDSPRVTCAVFR